MRHMSSLFMRESGFWKQIQNITIARNGTTRWRRHNSRVYCWMQGETKKSGGRCRRCLQWWWGRWCLQRRWSRRCRAAEEENDDLFYVSESDDVHFVIMKEKNFLFYNFDPLFYIDMKFFYNSEWNLPDCVEGLNFLKLILSLKIIN